MSRVAWIRPFTSLDWFDIGKPEWLRQLRAFPTNDKNISLVDRNHAKLLQAQLLQMLNALTVYNTIAKLRRT